MKPFQLKQFTIAQDRCAMKIGTDGILLGAWTPLEKNIDAVLDIGAGTGIIALQLAQRSTTQVIDAIEIDVDAYEQCTENFENSPWNDRLFCYHASFQEFVSEMDDSYDLIVSNPPFFTETYQTRDAARNKARFEDALPFEHLLIGVTHLLSENGNFTTIIPKQVEISFIKLANDLGLFLNRVCYVQGTPNTAIKRCLLQLSFEEKSLETQHLIIETERHNYTKEYITLVKDFYLKM